MPCLLLRNQGLVKTVNFKNPRYLGDPINIVKIFNEKEIDELVILDIGATIEGKPPSLPLLRDIAGECFVPLAFGGGVRSLRMIQDVLRLGFEKVVINTQAVENPKFIREASTEFGSQSIVVSIDVKKTLLGRYEVVTRNARKSTGLDPGDFAQRMEDCGAGELLLNSVDRDGTLRGYDLELLRRTTQRVGLPVIACGGAGSLEHFREAIHDGRASAVAAGSFFVFQGRHRAVLITFPTQKQLETLFPARNLDYKAG